MKSIEYSLIQTNAADRLYKTVKKAMTSTNTNDIEGIVKGAYKVFSKAWDRDWMPVEFDEAGNWLREKLTSLTAQVRGEEKANVIEKIKEIGHQQEDDSIWCNMDELIEALEADK